MSLFIQLPEDLQRVVSSFLERKEIDKVPSKIFNNPYDIFWKERIKHHISHLETINYQTICDGLYYREILERMTSSEVDKMLIKKLVDDKNFLQNHIHAHNSSGYNLLTILCYQKKEYEAEIIKLFSYGAKPSAFAFELAIQCKNYKIVEMFIKAGADVNHQTSTGWIPLMNASIRNDLEIAKVLLQHGANVHLQSKTHPTATALSLARSEEMKKLLSSY